MRTTLASFLCALLFLGSAACTHSDKKDTQTSNSSATRPALPTKAEDVKPVIIGTKLPAISLPVVQAGQTTLTSMNLAESAQKNPIVLIFYRGGWCPYCNVQLQDLRKIEAPLKKLGYQIIAVTPDRGEMIQESVSKLKLNYNLASDSKAELAQALNIAYTLDNDTNAKMATYGIDIEKASGQTHHILPVPSVFIVDKTGTITFNYVNPDYRVRLPANVILEAAKAGFKPLSPKM